jgi:hypothetical protein
MSEREVLPYRRTRITIEFEHQGIKFYGGAGYYPDGRVGEIFLSTDKPNSARDIDTKDAAIAASLALQAGISVQTLANAFLRNEDGSPAGPLGKMFQTLLREQVDG